MNILSNVMFTKCMVFSQLPCELYWWDFCTTLVNFSFFCSAFIL